MNLRDLLDKGLQDQGLNLPEDQRDTLLQFLDLLHRWNQVYNLTAVRDPQKMVIRHLLDSLTLLPFLEAAENIADLGSGGGLPGIPLAICCPEKQFTLIDSNSKKTRFLVHASTVLKLSNVSVIHTRTQDYRPEKLFDALMARAFATPAKIISIGGHLCRSDGQLLLMAGVLEELDVSGSKEFLLQSTTPVRVYNEPANRHILIFKRLPKDKTGS